MDTLIILEILQVIQTSRLYCELLGMVKELWEGHIITYDHSKKKSHNILKKIVFMLFVEGDFDKLKTKRVGES